MFLHVEFRKVAKPTYQPTQPACLPTYLASDLAAYPSYLSDYRTNAKAITIDMGLHPYRRLRTKLDGVFSPAPQTLSLTLNPYSFRI